MDDTLKYNFVKTIFCIFIQIALECVLRSLSDTKSPLFEVLLDAEQGAVSIRKTVLTGVAIPMLKIRRPNGRLIFNIGIAIPR